ncbi:MAG: Hsp70 family protein [Selenomonadaceae bacterium]|nr:Hsp70 family protein [Selenomonadaceae bacterium]
MAEVLFGIDFGACNLKCVRLVNKKISGVRLHTKDDGSFHAPNAICYSKTKDGSIQKVIGQAALNKGAMEPENLIINLKRKLEQRDWRQFIPALGREVTAPEVVEDIFKRIYEIAKGNLSKDDIACAMVTVPIIFTKNQRQMIAKAASNAGFKVDGVINEAFASIFSAKTLNDSFNVVFDFGGSTLDVSIIKVTGNEVHELAAAGLHLGGLDIDRDILEKVLKPTYETILNAAWDIINRDDFQMSFAQKLKEAIYADDYGDEVCADLIDANFDKIILSRAEINELLEREGYAEKINALLDELFDALAEHDECFDKSDVTKIWALGGSLRIPYFRTLLEDYFGAELFEADAYDFEDVEDFLNGLEDKYLAVAGGAANFLKQRGQVTTINAIPYRVSFALGEKIYPGLSKNSPAGFETMYKPLKVSELASADWKIELYQSFDDEASFEESAYLASVQLDSTLYDKEETPLLKLKMMRDGRLRLRVGVQRTIDGEPDLILLEQHFLRLED